MIYSYTQIANYLRCPRSYRYRYLDGWREKETRAALIFGRCFEKALAKGCCKTLTLNSPRISLESSSR
jgi:PD-(D/E)XK nuclease superfamily